MCVVLTADAETTGGARSPAFHQFGDTASDQGNRPWSPAGGKEIVRDGLKDSRPDVKRHQEAYNEMVRDAAPMRQALQERNPESPNRKRRKILETGRSETSSNFDPSSPQRISEENGYRPLLRRLSPQSETRRKSAPSRLIYSRAVEAGAEEKVGGNRSVALEPEVNNSSPLWLRKAVLELLQKYPDDEFKPEDEKVRCCDCNGSVFQAGPNQTLNNFERHLNRRQHRANVTKRLTQKERSRPPNLFGTMCLPTTADFGYQPAQPLALSAQQQSSTSFEILRANMTQYFVALENDAISKAVRNTMLEERIAVSAKKQEDRFTSLYEQLSLSKLESKEGLEQIVAFAEKNREDLGLLSQQLSASNSETKGCLLKLSEDLARANLTGGEQGLHTAEKTWQQLDNLSKMITKSNRRQKDELEDISVRMTMSGNSTQARLQQLSQQVKTLEMSKKKQDERIDELELQSRLHSEETKHQCKREKTLWKELDAEIERCNKQLLSKIQMVENIASERIAQAEKRSREKMKFLVNVKEEQERQHGVLQAVIPELIEEIKELREQVEQLKKRKCAPKSTASRSRPTPRRVSRRSSNT